MALDRQDVLDRFANGGARDLSGVDLSGADLSHLDLHGAVLARSDLTGADLRWTNLEGADLEAAVLRRADARWALLRGAGLRNADLNRTNLSWADLAGADLRGADMDDVRIVGADLTEAILPEPARRRDAAPWREGSATAQPLPFARGLVVGRWLMAVLAGLAVAITGLVWIWGWLFRRSYYVDGFGIQAAGAVVSIQAANLVAGLARVVPLILGALLFIPLFLAALLVVIGLLALVPSALIRLTEEILNAPGARPGVRLATVAAIWIALAVLVALLLPVVFPLFLAWAPPASVEAGPFSVFYFIATSGPTWARLGLVAVALLSSYAAWLGWRWASARLQAEETPLTWRVRYPGLDAAVRRARQSRLFSRNEPLTPDERRNARAALAAIVVLLGFVVTDAGRVYALDDMCDGGRLPRGQLYLYRAVHGADPRAMCQRLVAETERDFFAFFPGQTTEVVPGDPTTREAVVGTAAKSGGAIWVAAAGRGDCPVCTSPEEERHAVRAQFLIDPDESEVEGIVESRAGDLAFVTSVGQITRTVRIGANTLVTSVGANLGSGAVQPGVPVRAVGRFEPDPDILQARLIEVIPAQPVPPAAPLAVGLSDPTAIVIGGASFTPGSSVVVGLGPVTATGPQVPLVPDVTVGSDGSFSVVVAFRPDLPTGPDIRVFARDGQTSQFAVGPWYDTPPAATPTPAPTATPAVVEEETPQGAAATNTPLPTQASSGGGGGVCTPDSFEPDWPRGFEKEIFLTFGTSGTPQEHTFCGRGDRPRSDIDLAYFRVKAGRWYRVSTTELSPGVDTVLAVGDLDPSTACQPAGCWNDDRATLTLESEVVFRAVADGRAMITVDNRGGAHGDEARYKLLASEFEPEPTKTPTPAPTPTITPTPTASRTPLPFIDLFEPNDRCSQAYDPLEVDRELEATIDSRQDEDWFQTEALRPGFYRLEMQPPADMDYDVTLHELVDAGRNECPLLSTDGRTSGAGRREVIDIEVVPEDDGVAFGVLVFSRYKEVYFDPQEPYVLVLRWMGDGSDPASPAPTGTGEVAEPTSTPAAPTPDGAIRPRRAPDPTAAAMPGAARDPNARSASGRPEVSDAR